MDLPCIHYCRQTRVNDCHGSCSSGSPVSDLQITEMDLVYTGHLHSHFIFRSQNHRIPLPPNAGEVSNYTGWRFSTLVALSGQEILRFPDGGWHRPGNQKSHPWIETHILPPNALLQRGSAFSYQKTSSVHPGFWSGGSSPENLNFSPWNTVPNG